MIRPDAEQVRQLGADLGFDLDPVDTEHIRALLHDVLPAFDGYEEAARSFSAPPSPTPERRWWRPSVAGNPHRALIHACVVPGSTSGPLHGKRVAIKDCIAIAGVPMTLGTKFLGDYVPDFDATVVARLLEAGATIVGTANLEPLACGIGVAGSRDFGHVDNPLAPGYSAGGSSSGSAAAVASGLADLALGTDTLGSIRVPAAWCGISGLKPTHGLVPQSGALGHEFFHDHVGPMAADLDTLRRALAALAGPDGLDSRQTGPPHRDRPADLASTQDREREVPRIGVLREGLSEAGDPAVQAAFARAVDTWRSVGASVREVSAPVHRTLAGVQMPFFYESLATWWHSGLLDRPQDGMRPRDLVDALARAQADHPDLLPLFVRTLVVLGTYVQKHSRWRYSADVVTTRAHARAEYDSLWDDVDILVMPTVPILPPRYELGRTSEEARTLAVTGGVIPLATLASVTMNTAPFNFTGHPALTLPIARTRAGGIGMQFVGPLGADHRLVDLAERLHTELDHSPP